MGGILERVSLPAPTQLAAGQRLPAHRPPTAAADFQCLLQVYFPHSHRDWKHLDAFAWYYLVFTQKFHGGEKLKKKEPNTMQIRDFQRGEVLTRIFLLKNIDFDWLAQIQVISI